jgi:hypothetical protein
VKQEIYRVAGRHVRKGTALRVLVVSNSPIVILSASWPDLFRPSTSFFRQLKKDVDARDKRGHDGSEYVAASCRQFQRRLTIAASTVMAGLVPVINVFPPATHERRGCPRRARA